MGISDKAVGTILLIVSFVILLYLFILLILIPILPIDDYIEKFTPRNIVLNISGIIGLMFIGSLGLFTIYTIINN